jgi:KaiC/GvpD/RAD55 family RecA-like ATPase
MANDEEESAALALVPSGTPGLDDVMRGGFTPYGLYLIEGDPGSGKTTLALQFMMEGVRRGERCMYVTLSEDERELRAAAASHGWSLDGIDIFEIVPSEDSLTNEARYTMYHPSEVELAETTKAVLAESARIKPRRLVLDSLSELRMLAETPLRYRRQILALKRHFTAQRVTSLFIDDKTGAERDLALHSSAQGVFNLGTVTPPFGATRRQLQVHKLRGRAFREGLHDLVIRHEGLRVYPRLVAAEHKQSYARDSVQAASPSSTSCWAAASRKAPARSSSAPPAPASRRSPRSSSSPQRRATSTRPSTSSTKASRRSSSARPGSAWMLRRSCARVSSACGRSIRPSCRPANSRTTSARPSRTRRRSSW